jgi:hypothetical protein
MCRSFRPRVVTPTPFLEQSLEILSCCSQQRFTIHAPQSSEAKAPHAMPVFALGK